VSAEQPNLYDRNLLEACQMVAQIFQQDHADLYGEAGKQAWQALGERSLEDEEIAHGFASLVVLLDQGSADEAIRETLPARVLAWIARGVMFGHELGQRGVAFASPPADD
jgi:hypothetical protein